MMQFSVVFSNNSNQKFKIPYETYASDIAKRWANALKKQCEINPIVAEKDRLYGFPNREWTEEKIVNELNSCIEIINRNKQVIHHTAFKGMPRQQLNHLHHYFENLRGGILSPTAFWNTANQHTREALNRFNIVIHRAEDFYNSKNSNKIQPRAVCTFSDRERHFLKDDDYKHFTMARKFGEVYINYCEVGKPIYDVYRDNDDIVGEDNIRPLRYYSADFSLYFHDKNQEEVKKFISGLNLWWDSNSKYLKELGFEKNDPKNAIGLIPVAMIEHSHESEQDIIESIANVGRISHVEIHNTKGEINE